MECIYNNYKWRITLKNCESLYCTFVTHIILYINYSSIKNNWSVEVSSKCYCRTVCFSLQFCQFLLHVFCDFVVRCICVYNFYLFGRLVLSPIYNVPLCYKFFNLKSILFDISIASSDLFCLLFGWSLFFQPFIFNQFLGIWIKIESLIDSI